MITYELEQHLREAVGRIRRHTLARAQRSDGVIGAKDIARSVDKVDSVVFDERRFCVHCHFLAALSEMQKGGRTGLKATNGPSQSRRVAQDRTQLLRTLFV